MGPYGSVGAHIKTGRSPMAQDHFKTPSDPQKGHGIIKNPQKSKGISRAGQEANANASKDETTLQEVLDVERSCNHLCSDACTPSKADSSKGCLLALDNDTSTSPQTR